MSEVFELDGSTQLARVGAAVAKLDRVLYFVGGLETGAPRVRDSWISLSAVDTRQNGRWWAPDNANAGVCERLGHCCVAANNSLWVFGGESADASRRVLGDTHRGAVSARGVVWNGVESSERPCARAWAGACCVAGNGEAEIALMHGGRDGAGRALDCCWILEGSPPVSTTAAASSQVRWSQLAVSGEKPRARHSHTLTAVGHGARCAVLAGGALTDGGLSSDEVWVLDLAPCFVYGAAVEVGKKSTSEKKKKSHGSFATDPAEAIWSQVALPGPRCSLHCAVGWLGTDESSQEVWTLALFGGQSSSQDDGDAASSQAAAAASSRVRLLEVVVDASAQSGPVEKCRWSEARWTDGARLPNAARAATACVAAKGDAAGCYVAGGMPALGPSSSEETASQECCASSWLRLSHSSCEPPAFVLAHLRYARDAFVEDDLGDEPPPGWGQEQPSPNGDVFEGQFQEGEREGQGRCVYANDGGSYEGGWRAGQRAGLGTWTACERAASGGGGVAPTDEVRYEGEWIADLRHGSGSAAFSDGGLFEGEYLTGLRHYGTMRYCSGESYVGQFAGGREGTGTGRYPDGGEYVGCWLRDARHGRGRMVYADGSVYEGEWHGGRRNGAGRCAFANRDAFEGKWVADERCGRGAQTYASGATYDGEWLRDSRDGRGTLRSADGSQYSGEWRKDRRHGSGEWRWSKGRAADSESEYAGEWRAGERHGAGSSKYLDGSTFEGTFKRDSRHEGETRHLNGDWYSGCFERHARHGRGVVRSTDGSKYDGEWREGARDGRGRFTTPFEQYDGEWARNERHGRGRWKGTRELDDEVTYDGRWTRGRRDGDDARSTYESGATFEGTYAADVRASGTAKYPNGDAYEGKFDVTGRSGLGECTYYDGGTFVGEWKNDKKETDKGKWVGVEDVHKHAATYKKRSIFSRSSKTPSKYAVVPA